MEIPLHYEIYKDGTRVGVLENVLEVSKDTNKKWIVQHEGAGDFKYDDHFRFYANMDLALDQFMPGRLSLFGKDETSYEDL